MCYLWRESSCHSGPERGWILQHLGYRFVDPLVFYVLSFLNSDLQWLFYLEKNCSLMEGVTVTECDDSPDGKAVI